MAIAVQHSVPTSQSLMGDVQYKERDLFALGRLSIDHNYKIVKLHTCYMQRLLYT